MRFLLIDRITDWNPGKTGKATKNVALSEDLFDDHFPLKPIMPGVMMIEGMAQLSGLVIEEGVRRESGRNVKALMSIVEKAKFRKPVYPGDSLEYRMAVLSVNDDGAKAQAQAFVGNDLVAECGLVFSLHAIDNERLEDRRSDVLSFWLRDARTDD
jgi:3-hydroxyacyl-[acyl-carrier-protein] dehydratase